MTLINSISDHFAYFFYYIFVGGILNYGLCVIWPDYGIIVALGLTTISAHLLFPLVAYRSTLTRAFIWGTVVLLLTVLTYYIVIELNPVNIELDRAGVASLFWGVIIPQICYWEICRYIDKRIFKKLAPTPAKT